MVYKLEDEKYFPVMKRNRSFVVGVVSKIHVFILNEVVFNGNFYKIE